MLEAFYQLRIVKFQTISFEISELRPKERIVLQFGKGYYIKTESILVACIITAEIDDPKFINLFLQSGKEPFTKGSIHNIFFCHLFHYFNGILKFQFIIQEITFRRHEFSVFHDTTHTFRSGIVV